MQKISRLCTRISRCEINCDLNNKKFKFVFRNFARVFDKFFQIFEKLPWEKMVNDLGSCEKNIQICFINSN